MVSRQFSRRTNKSAFLFAFVLSLIFLNPVHLLASEVRVYALSGADTVDQTFVSFLIKDQALKESGISLKIIPIDSLNGVVQRLKSDHQSIGLIPLRRIEELFPERELAYSLLPVQPALGISTSTLGLKHSPYETLLLNEISDEDLLAIGLWEGESRSFLVNNQIRSVKDLVGKKFTVAGAWTYYDSVPLEMQQSKVNWNITSPNPSNDNEVYSTLKTGIIDAVEWDTKSLSQASYAAYHSKTIIPEFRSEIGAIFTSRRFWVELSPKNSEILKSAIDRANRYVTEQGWSYQKRIAEKSIKYDSMKIGNGDLYFLVSLDHSKNWSAKFPSTGKNAFELLFNTAGYKVEVDKKNFR
jgi:TRAP-type C4-dicarboxylate transport system substrate-binding protein